MKIEKTVVQKIFFIQYKGKSYVVDYLNSDGQILGLINRNNWEIYTDDGEELDIYFFKNDSEEKNKRVNENLILTEKLVKYCIKHFKDYNPVNDELDF